MNIDLFKTLENRIIKYPDSLVSNGKDVITYNKLISEVYSLSDKIDNYFIAWQKCAILCNDEVTTGISILACFKAKITVIPISIRYGAEHCKKILKLCNPDLVIIDSEEFISLLNEFSCSIYLYEDNRLIKEGKQQIPEKELSDVAAIMCTSGTTGDPKGIMLTDINIWANLLDIADYFEIEHNDRILISRPLYHAAALTGEFLISLYKGLDIYFYNGQFDPFQVQKSIINNKITVLCGTPTLYNYLLDYLKRSKVQNTLKVCVASGECLTEAVIKKMLDLLPETKKYNVYGLTEASPRVTYLPPEVFGEKYLSVGKPLKSVQCKIVDDFEYEVNNGVCGELIIKAPSVMKGYYRNPLLTKKVLKNGWLFTGDLAIKDKKGLITIKSRKDNLIIHAGMNIYPQEIENVLKSDKRIKDVVVYVLKSAVGQGVGIKVVQRNESVTKEVVYKICREKLASHMMPDCIEIVEKIDISGSGKSMRSLEKRV